MITIGNYFLIVFVMLDFVYVNLFLSVYVTFFYCIFCI